MITIFMHHVIYKVIQGTSKKNVLCVYILYLFSITLTFIYLEEHKLRTSVKVQVPKLLRKYKT